MRCTIIVIKCELEVLFNLSCEFCLGLFAIKCEDEFINIVDTLGFELRDPNFPNIIKSNQVVKIQ